MATLLSCRALVLLVAGAVGCSGGELLLPEPPGTENVALSKYEGDNQQGTVGEELPAPLVVQVLTVAREQPATGRKVEFVTTSAGVELARDTSVTNSQGLATMLCVLGTAPGDYLIQARMADVEGEAQSQDFLAKAKPGPPDTLTALSPTSQPGVRGQNAGNSPQVLIVDRYGNPVPEVMVAWQVTAGEGHISQPITRTDERGISGVDWTLGNRSGVHKLTATIERATGSPVTFTATVLF